MVVNTKRDDWWDMTSEQVPRETSTREIDLLWGKGEGPKRGPKPKLTRSAVVEAAVGVADAEGLESLSMQRVAKELGYTTMSLYRYVDSKEDLLLLMMEAVAATEPPVPAGDWRSGVEAWFRAIVAMYGQHPWSVYIPTTGPPSGPNNLRWMEAGLRELSASGLRLGEALNTLLLLTSVARDMLRMELETNGVSTADGTPQENEASWAQGLAAVVDPRVYPTVHRLLSASFEEGWWEEYSTVQEDMLFPLHRVLDGIEVHVAAQAGGDTRRS